jgi:hydroxymethylpyrimidine pyrophosphatase-like HAD family hydrolase
MIEYAGLGVAVGNAMDELKEKANIITVNAEENAVAVILEKIMRDEI